MGEITPGAIASAVAGQIPAFFNDAFDQFRQGEGGYLANGQPEGIVAQIGQAVGRAACRRFGADPDGDFLNSERFERACRPYLDTLDPGNGAEVDLPFTGGQCEGVLYRATGDIPHSLRNCSTGQVFPDQPRPVSTEIQWVGPIVSVKPIYSNPGQCGNRSFILEIVHGGGQFTGNFGFTTNPINELFNARFVGSFTDATGQEGNCGFPPPEVRQPRPIADPEPPPFRFNPGPGIDIGIDVDINPDGTINVDFGDGDINIDPFPDGDNATGGGGGAPPTPGEPGSSDDTGAGNASGEGGEAEGDAPEGKVLTGVRIDILEAPSARSRFSPEVDRGVAYVYMGEPSEGLGLEPTGALVRDGQFFFAQKDYLTRWAVRARFGYNLRVTPYYKDAPE